MTRSTLHTKERVVAAIRAFLAAAEAERGAVDAMTLLIAQTASVPLVRLDAWERILRAEIWAIDRGRSVRRPWFRKDSKRLVSWVDLCSGDGHQRERSLRVEPDVMPNGFFLALAIRRLNDWVPQVRAAACNHLPRLARRLDPGIIVEALWSLLPHATSWGRMGIEERQVLDDLASTTGVAAVLESRLKSATTGPTASILSQVGRTSVLDSRMSELARNAIQPSVRAKAYRTILEGRMTWIAGRRWKWIDLKWCKGRFEPILGERPLSIRESFVTCLRAASADSAVAVRRVAGELLSRHVESGGVDCFEIAETLANDRSESVAIWGRSILARM